jgi:hypothetical protein
MYFTGYPLYPDFSVARCDGADKAMDKRFSSVEKNNYYKS